MITQITGNKIYKSGGTRTGLSVNLMNEKTFRAGRMAAENHRQNAVLKPSSNIENKAKLIEKRLSIVCYFGDGNPRK